MNIPFAKILIISELNNTKVIINDKEVGGIEEINFHHKSGERPSVDISMRTEGKVD